MDETQACIFPYDGGNAIYTTQEPVTIEWIETMVVFDGLPYLIIPKDSLPSAEDQLTWVVDYSNPDGYGRAV